MEKAGYLPYLRHLFISEEIGAAKPSPLFFEACLAALAPLRPDEVLMIGDSLTADIAGAAGCGIRTCWYRHGSCKDGSAADYCVADLREICGIL
jgi:2-haloacid dehalogenase